MHLTDFRVRILRANDASGAQPRVWIEPGEVVKFAVIGDDGKPLMTRRGNKYQSEVQYFTWRGDLAAIVEERRRVYARWAEGVAAVLRALRESSLRKFALRDDLPPGEPWAY